MTNKDIKTLWQEFSEKAVKAADHWQAMLDHYSSWKEFFSHAKMEITAPSWPQQKDMVPNMDFNIHLVNSDSQICFNSKKIHKLYKNIRDSIIAHTMPEFRDYKPYVNPAEKKIPPHVTGKLGSGVYVPAAIVMDDNFLAESEDGKELIEEIMHNVGIVGQYQKISL